MSSIDPTAPLDSLAVSSSDEALREERVWLNDLMTAFQVAQQNASSAGNPTTLSGLYNVPFAAPGSPTVGAMYFTSGGLVYGYKSGPTLQLLGTLASGDKTVLRQSAAPTGWTRDTGQTNGSVLRYVTGTLSGGGTYDINTAFTHGSGSTFTKQPASSGVNLVQQEADHSILKYLDVILCSKN